MNIDKAFKILKEELLLEGKSWENFYDSLDNDAKNRLIKVSEKSLYNKLDKILILKILRFYDPTATEANAGKYSMWLIKKQFKGIFAKKLASDYAYNMHNKNNIFYNTLERFNRIGNNLEKSDINQYDNIVDLRDAIEEYKSKKSTKKLKGKADVQSGKWGIKKIDSAKESCELGKGTKWCITNKEAFDNYNKLTTIFFLTDGKKKYAITVAKGEGLDTTIVYDEQDSKIGGKDFLTNNFPKEILDYIKKQINVNEEFVDLVKTSFDSDEQYSIYKNPNSREIRDILKEQNGKELRMIADVDNKNMYVFSANLLHYKAGQELYNKLGNKYGDNTILMQGIYKPKERKIKVTTIMINKKLIKNNKEWLEKYLIFKDKVNEEYVDMMNKVNGEGTASIYRNPSSREMKNLIKESGSKRVRIIIDFDKNHLYVFPADLLHAVASKKLGIDYRDKIGSKIFAEGGYSLGKIHSLKVNALSRTFTDDQKKWLKRYIAL